MFDLLLYEPAWPQQLLGRQGSRCLGGWFVLRRGSLLRGRVVRAAALRSGENGARSPQSAGRAERFREPATKRCAAVVLRCALFSFVAK